MAKILLANNIVKTSDIKPIVIIFITLQTEKVVVVMGCNIKIARITNDTRRYNIAI